MRTSNQLPIENLIHRTGDAPFSLHHTVLSDGNRCALYLHCHPEAEFFYLEEGTLYFSVENQTFLLAAGDAVFLPPGLIHSAERADSADAPCSYRAVVFSIELLEQNSSTGKIYFSPLYSNRPACIFHIPCAESACQPLLSHLRQLLLYKSKPLETYELALNGMLFVCWQELYNLHLSDIQPPSQTDQEHRNLQQSIDYILLHFSEPLTLASLANEAGFSEGYFCQRFKSHTGYSPFEYVNRIRIAKSCELLAGTDKKIAEIATLCGFNHISYFNRIFVRITGETPSVHRKKYHLER